MLRLALRRAAASPARRLASLGAAEGSYVAGAIRPPTAAGWNTGAAGQRSHAGWLGRGFSSGGEAAEKKEEAEGEGQQADAAKAGAEADNDGRAGLEAGAKEAIQALALLRRCRQREEETTGLMAIIWPFLKYFSHSSARKRFVALDPEFEEEELLEAVGDAYCMVNHLLSGRDLETLRPMMTTQLHESFAETANKIDELGFTVKVDVEEVKAVGLEDFNFMSRRLARLIAPSLGAMLPCASAEEAKHASLDAWRARKAAKKEGGSSQLEFDRVQPDGAGEQEGGEEEGEEPTASNRQVWGVLSTKVVTQEQWVFTSKEDPSFVKRKSFQNCVSMWRFGRGPLDIENETAADMGVLAQEDIRTQFEGARWVLMSTFW
eukprot:jgi/Tetstr1/423079/TSEL_013850.t1